jgi:hypothetical protein
MGGGSARRLSRGREEPEDLLRAVATLLRVEDVTPTMRRVRGGGDGLADPAALRRLLRYLAVTRARLGRRVRSRAHGRGHRARRRPAQALRLRRPLPRRDLAAAGLLDAVRTGRAGVAAVLGPQVEELPLAAGERGL